MKLIQIGDCYGAGDYFRNMYDKKSTIPYSFLRKNTIEDLQLDDETIIMYGGGEDIWPGIYGEKQASPYVYVPKASERDVLEQSIFYEGVKKNSMHLGICRGAQLITAASGGKLWQHVSNHNRPHSLSFDFNNPCLEGLKLPSYTTSVHHQMCRIETIPYKTELLAWSKETSKYVNEKGMQEDSDYKEPEIFYIPEIKALCIQGHPEFEALSGDFSVFCNQLANKLWK